MLPDLNRLKVFYHVYSLQSMNMAAKNLHLTQPGVSQHIKKLEVEIKTDLFIRRHKKIIPTRAADQLFDMVKPFIETIDSKIKNISRPMNQPYGLLRIGAPLEFGKTYFPAICHAFREKYNQVTFKIKLEEPDRLLDMLNMGLLDFVVIDYFSAKDQFFGRPEHCQIDLLTEEIFVLASSKEYFENKMKKKTSFEMLVSMDFITDEHEPVILKHWFWHYFKKSIPSVNIIMAIESHQALLNCVRLGMGLAITAEHLIWNEIETGEIIPIFPTKKKVINKISLVQLRDKKPTLTEETFQAFLKKQIKAKKIPRKPA
ncbi:MAG: LysR family transcriptional regulator [Deltaproteobacteria bacterium]|nr:LysR family transcriptional regulator [Deltaproteobacteria bacterium]